MKQVFVSGLVVANSGCGLKIVRMVGDSSVLIWKEQGDFYALGEFERVEQMKLMSNSQNLTMLSLDDRMEFSAD